MGEPLRAPVLDTRAAAAAAAVPRSAAKPVALTPIFAFTLFISAGLIFTIEPLFGKMVLPLLGGTPAVWNTCMVFFQAVLLGGYAYAHVISRALGTRGQLLVHAGLLLAAAVALPVAIPQASVPSAAGSPVAWLLGTLTLALGAPLLVLSATAPLLQKWFSTTDDTAARNPYFLYAASNAGSIAALLAYPLLIEPSFSLTHQRQIWTIGYAGLTALTLAAGITALRRPAATSGLALAAPVEHVTWRRRARWLALSLVPSSLMLSVTTYLSTDVAAVPLLWTVPLALYLLSFVISFSERRLMADGVVRRAMIGVTLPIAGVLLLQPTMPIWIAALLHLSLLFVFSVALHTELANSRPDSRRLTEFYLWVAVGGVLGGLLNTLLAPRLFTSIAEYPIAVAAGCALRPLWPAGARRSHAAGWLFPILAGVLTVALVLALEGRAGLTKDAALPVGIAIIFAFVMSASDARWFATAAVLTFAAILAARQDPRDLLYAKRTFFGVYRVMEAPAAHQHTLTHGTTLHGAQSTEPGRAGEPTFYYHRSGPIGQVFAALADRLHNASIGAVGLGAGTLAAYAQPGQRWTFYEIDPEMQRIARNSRYFTYLDRCGDSCRVVLGDARLSLAGDSGARHALLMLDAFSSDAIPVHLLTREALDVYLDHVEDAGLIAVHISNRHLDLRPLLAGLAAERGLVTRDQLFKADKADPGQTNSEWVLLARSAGALGPIAVDRRWTPLQASAGTRLWTDDFSDIVGVLKPIWK